VPCGPDHHSQRHRRTRISSIRSRSRSGRAGSSPNPDRAGARNGLDVLPDPHAANVVHLAGDLSLHCGCQYTSQQFTALATEFDIRLSVGRTGQCQDHVIAESFFATSKRELLDTSAWPCRATAHTATFKFIEGWYNSHRLHNLGYRSHDECETAFTA